MTVKDLISLLLDAPLDAEVTMRGFNKYGDFFDEGIVKVFPLYSTDGFVGICITNDEDED